MNQLRAALTGWLVEQLGLPADYRVRVQGDPGQGPVAVVLVNTPDSGCCWLMIGDTQVTLSHNGLTAAGRFQYADPQFPEHIRQHILRSAHHD